MKEKFVLSFVFICFCPLLHPMELPKTNSVPNVLLRDIMSRVCAMEKSTTPDGTTEYKATLVDKDVLQCKQHKSGTIEVHYLLYLHQPSNRDKAKGQTHEKIDLRELMIAPPEVLQAMEIYKKNNSTAQYY